MMVFWDQRLVVLSTPKTGSTALETALGSRASLISLRPPELKHTPAYRYRRFLAPFLEKTANGPFMVVAVMREPLDWLGSWYRFRSRKTLPAARHDTSNMSFDEFVEGYIAEPRLGFAAVGSQARFLSDKGGKAVDRIFAYENQPEFLAFLEQRLAMTIRLKRENVSPAMPLSLSLSVENRLRSACAEDFALYDLVCQGKA